MNLGSLAVVYRKELRDLLRDRRTIISMIVVPVLVIPVLMIGMGGAASVLIKKARSEKAKVMILGGKHAPQIVESIKSISQLEIVPPDPDYTNLISSKEIRAAVQIPENFSEDLSEEEQTEVTIYVYQGEIKSQFGASTLEEFFRDLREETVEQRLHERGLSSEVIHPFQIRQENVAPPKKVSGNLIGSVLPYIIILMCMTGGMYPAIDLTAGEKERGTIETLLCCPASRTQIIIGKFLMVLTASMATTLLSLLSLGGSFVFAAQVLGNGGSVQGLPISIDVLSLLWVFVIILPVAIFFAALMLAVSLFARSYKEAQSYISPMMLIVIVPAMTSLMPGIELNAFLSLVPVMNVSLLCKDLLSGTYQWGHIGWIFLSSCVYAGGALWFSVWVFQREGVLFRT